MSSALSNTGAAIAIVLALCAPARAQEIDPAFRADIEKLLDATGASANAERVATLVSNQAIDNLRRQQPQLPSRVAEIIKEVVSSEFSRAFDAPDGIRTDMIRIYANHFTHDEVIAVLAFYNTPVGRKMVTQLPQLMEEGAAAGQRWAAANMPRVNQVLQQRLRDEGFLKERSAP